MDKKTCLFCKHFELDMGSPGYSELTPGEEASFRCMKNHWSMGNYDGAEKFRIEIERAKRCSDFDSGHSGSNPEISRK